MRTESRPNSDYTRTWSPSGEIEYAKLGDGTRLRYLKAGSGPADLILLHTVRTQLDHFQLVIPKIAHAFSIYAIDMPGMGWSDITPEASCQIIISPNCAGLAVVGGIRVWRAKSSAMSTA